MGIRKSRAAAGLSANGLAVRVRDEVTWRDPILKDLRTGTVTAVTTAEARLVDDRNRTLTLPFGRLTVARQAREDDKTAALIAVYRALQELADGGDLTAFTFLANDWPVLVSADLRALLDLGPDGAEPGP